LELQPLDGTNQSQDQETVAAQIFYALGDCRFGVSCKVFAYCKQKVLKNIYFYDRNWFKVTMHRQSDSTVTV
jgi:hypothetical protein